MTEKDKMLAGMLYDSGEAELVELRRFAQRSCEVYNAISATERSERRAFMQSFLGSTGERVTIESSFKCDYGFNIHLGDGFYSNYDLVILDVCEVKIGKNCMIGPRVSIITATHPLDAQERISGLEYGKPIVLGDNVWIGANAVINPGVTLGDNVVVASGAVVTKSFGDNVLIGGVPAKVIKNLVPGVTPGTRELDKIAACEAAYAKQFCSDYEDETIIRFRHPEIKDMYSLNYTFIKNKQNDLKMHTLFEEAIAFCKSLGEAYCNVVTNAPMDTRILDTIKLPYVLTTNGFYVFDSNKFDDIEVVDHCVIEKVTTLDALAELLKIEIDVDGPEADADFCTRRLNGKSPVYLSEGSVDAYICYHEGETIGRCDLFIFDGVAKIEDFSIYEKHQKKGYGKTILKHLIGIALEKGCDMIYLVTDENDTAKAMYLKSGFERLTETAEVRFVLPITDVVY